MASKYKTLPTNVGSARIADAIAAGVPLVITQAAVGDGGGAYYLPTPSQTGLYNERWRGDIVSSEVDPVDPSMFSVRFIVPIEVGGFFVREAALYDADGAMIFICNLPDTKKEAYTSGSSGKLTVIMHIVVTDSDTLVFELNPDIDCVTPAQLNEAIFQHDVSSTAHSDIRTDIDDVVDTIANDLYTRVQTDQRIGNAVNTHDTSETAHGDIRISIAGLDSRVTRLEKIVDGGIATNPFSVTFASLAGTVVAGVWNREQGRIEF